MSFHLYPPAIYLITTGEATPANFDQTSLRILDIVRVAVEEKVSLVQLREKCLTARLLFEVAVKAVAITSGSSTRLLVNDRVDVALAARADGVHLAANSIGVQAIRAGFPSGLIVGASTHTLAAARFAAAHGADFAVYGPVFETPEKGAPKGLESLAEVCLDLGPFPVLGLGGVDETNYHSMIDVGASGFAAIRFLNDEEKLRVVAQDLRT